MNCNSGIAEHCFGTGGCNGNELVRALYGVSDMPEAAFLFAILYLCVGKGGAAVGAPVDDAVAAVDKSLVIEVYKHLTNSARAALVHREALTRPVAGRAELFELIYNARAVLIFPVPYALEEFLSAEVVSCKSLVYSEVFLNLDLGCNARMVGAGNPEGGIALHTLGSYKYILEGLVKRVSHMKLTGYVRRGDNYREGRLFGVGVGRKILFLAPLTVNSFLKVARVVIFSKLFSHFYIPFVFESNLPEGAKKPQGIFSLGA